MQGVNSTKAARFELRPLNNLHQAEARPPWAVRSSPSRYLGQLGLVESKPAALGSSVWSEPAAFDDSRQA